MKKAVKERHKIPSTPNFIKKICAKITALEKYNFNTTNIATQSGLTYISRKYQSAPIDHSLVSKMTRSTQGTVLCAIRNGPKLPVTQTLPVILDWVSLS